MVGGFRENLIMDYLKRRHVVVTYCFFFFLGVVARGSCALIFCVWDSVGNAPRGGVNGYVGSMSGCNLSLDAWGIALLCLI